MTQFSAILVGNESLMRHAAETLISRGHRIAAIVTRNPELRDWAQGAGLAVEDQDAPIISTGDNGACKDRPRDQLNRADTSRTQELAAVSARSI